jgi:hypothetical protein
MRDDRRLITLEGISSSPDEEYTTITERKLQGISTQ